MTNTAAKFAMWFISVAFAMFVIGHGIDYMVVKTVEGSERRYNHFISCSENYDKSFCIQKYSYDK